MDESKINPGEKLENTRELGEDALSSVAGGGTNADGFYFDDSFPILYINPICTKAPGITNYYHQFIEEAPGGDTEFYSCVYCGQVVHRDQRVVFTMPGGGVSDTV